MSSIKLDFSGEGIHGDVELPASKSISNRVIIIEALGGGGFSLQNLSKAEDTQVLQSALEKSVGVVDVKDAGSALRFLTAYFTLGDNEVILTGSDRLKERPLGPLVESLRELGSEINYQGTEGCAPVMIKPSALKGGNVFVDANVSSQFASALCLIGPYLPEGLVVFTQNDIVSRPYIDMTVDLMRAFGAVAEFEGATIEIEPSAYKRTEFIVESDWSAASYLYSMAALSKSARIKLKGLNEKSYQGDHVMARWMELFGIKTTFESDGAVIQKVDDIGPEMVRLDFQANPDLVQTLAPLCVGLRIPFAFTGVSNLVHKETDRIAALAEELHKFGADVITGEDVIEVKHYSSNIPKSVAINTYGDHRMAMGFAPLAIIYSGLTINNPEVVRKSFPEFWDQLKSLGIKINN